MTAKRHYRNPFGRRAFLLGSAALLVANPGLAYARIIKGELPWWPGAGSPPDQVIAGDWVFFTPEEGALVEAMVDRLIPADDRTPGGKDMGCAVFIDHQLAGSYGRSEWLYMKPPFAKGSPQQGQQSSLTPAARYSQFLPAFDIYVRKAYGGRSFVALSDKDKDAILSNLEGGKIALGSVDAVAFFELLLKDTKEGFFSDPVYGGNRNMAAWKMIGFPGARYDYSDWVDRHNERYPLPPIGIAIN